MIETSRSPYDRQRQRARNRRGRHHQQVRALLALPASAPRWRTPKRCCSSITTKPRLAKRDRFLDQRVRADQDVDRAVARIAAAISPLVSPACCRSAARPPAAVRPQRGEERAEILSRAARPESRSAPSPRFENPGDRAKHGGGRDHGFAAADVPLEQAVHRRRQTHISQDFG